MKYTYLDLSTTVYYSIRFERNHYLSLPVGQEAECLPTDVCFSLPCKDLHISLSVPVTLSRGWHAEQIHCEPKEKGSTNVGKDPSARTDPAGQYHGRSHELLHCSVRLLSTVGKGYHWEARMTPGETWTFETLELAGILKLSKSRPLLVGNWAPEAGWGERVFEHKNWKWEESFKIRHSSHYHCIPYSFGHGNPQRCLLKIKIQSPRAPGWHSG